MICRACKTFLHVRDSHHVPFPSKMKREHKIKGEFVNGRTCHDKEHGSRFSRTYRIMLLIFPEAFSCCRKNSKTSMMISTTRFDSRSKYL